MIDHAPMEPMQLALAQLMSDLSEECWAAGWLSRTEYDIWALIHGERESWGMATAATLQEELAAIVAVAQACGSWIVWDKPVGTRAIPLERWVERYVEWKEAGA